MFKTENYAFISPVCSLVIRSCLPCMFADIGAGDSSTFVRRPRNQTRTIEASAVLEAQRSLSDSPQNAEQSESDSLVRTSAVAVSLGDIEKQGLGIIAYENAVMPRFRQ